MRAGRRSDDDEIPMADASAFHIAVIGSGPSGFYATEALLRSDPPVAVDMFEQLPVPYGLVRYGVAPDHPRLKQVTAAFDRIAAMPGFRFIGGGRGRARRLDRRTAEQL